MGRDIDKMINDITKDVKWIGVLDYNIKTFDIVMNTEFGTTYNSYFINAEQPALIEVAKEKFSQTYLDKLRKVIDPESIKYIIVDHTEPDHSGSIGILLKLSKGATIVGSGNAIRYLEDIINVPFKSLVVKDGDTLDLGSRTLKFIAAPNLHWPDSIYTYLVEDKILFTCDSFGAHYCSENLFSEFNAEYTRAFKYYFDVILKPFSRFMLKAIAKIRPLEINFICPGHGPVHRENIETAISLSEKYSEEYLKITESGDKIILIAYVSAYGYTSEAAEIIASGITESIGIKVDVTDIEKIGSDVLEYKLTRAKAIIVGSPTINQNTLLPVYRLFAHINPLRDRGKLAGAFGSFGWSGESPGIIIENLRQLKLKIFDENGSFKFRPEEKKKEALKDYGRKFAAKFLEECGNMTK